MGLLLDWALDQEWDWALGLLLDLASGWVLDSVWDSR